MMDIIKLDVVEMVRIMDKKGKVIEEREVTEEEKREREARFAAIPKAPFKAGNGKRQLTQTFKCKACGREFKVSTANSFSERGWKKKLRDNAPEFDIKWEASRMRCPYRVLIGKRGCNKLGVEEITGKGKGERPPRAILS